jgi:hypothetical protein
MEYLEEEKRVIEVKIEQLKKVSKFFEEIPWQTRGFVL